VIVEIFLIGFNVKGINISFCVCYMVEILMKVYAIGPQRFFKRFGNWYTCFTFVLHVRVLVLRIIFYLYVSQVNSYTFVNILVGNIDKGNSNTVINQWNV